MAEWIILELSSRAENEDPESIRKSIRGTLGNKAEVFIPAAITEIGDDRSVHWLANGYAFVRQDKFSNSLLQKLETTRFITAVLTQGPRLATVNDAAINKMRHQLRKEIDQGIGMGDKVMITTGPYRNIEATVVEDFPELGQVQVFIKLRSKQTLQTIPRSGLKVLERAPLSPLFGQLAALRAWTRRAAPVFAWKADPGPLKEKLAAFKRIDAWVDRGRLLYAYLAFHRDDLQTKADLLSERFSLFQQLDDWNSRACLLYTFIAFNNGDTTGTQLKTIQAKFQELLWFEDIQQRIKTLRREVEALGHKGAKRRKNGDVNVIQNVIVDGHNLAFRCLYAPGMGDLKDDKGRPTGVVLGVLKGLGALRKRFPEARIYMTWDGHSKRRKEKFADYKANRKSAREDLPKGGEAFDQIAFLRDLLPLLGVRQAWNAEEEADDVIASLVRGPLKDQHNLIFSTDRDLLQLVSDTTAVLKPRVSSRREVMYDRAAVVKEFGVLPEDLVQLRAFLGDKSDNIPGVSRVPKKVLTKLVQTFGSVDGVFESSLTGVTRGQYERLRSSEPQVRINVELMSLAEVPVSLVDPDVDPDGVAQRLREVAIKPTPIVDAFFGRETEAPN